MDLDNSEVHLSKAGWIEDWRGVPKV